MDDNFNDYFTDENVPEEKHPVHQETEQEREEREIKEATIERRGNSVKMLLMLIIVAMALFLGWWVWQYYFHPYRISQEKGWIMKVSIEGSIFQTFEGEMISEGYVDGDIGAIKSDFKFSIASDSLMSDAKRWAQNGQRVILTYDEYKGKVLWRGNSKCVVTKIERDSDLVKPNPYQEAPKPAETDK